MPLISRLRRGKLRESGRTPKGVFAYNRPSFLRLLGQLGGLLGVNDVQSVGQDSDGAPPVFQGSTVGDSVDASCQATNDRNPIAGQVGG